VRTRKIESRLARAEAAALRKLALDLMIAHAVDGVSMGEGEALAMLRERPAEALAVIERCTDEKVAEVLAKLGMEWPS
jgi:aspartokinase-like uncharacterized kinase